MYEALDTALVPLQGDGAGGIVAVVGLLVYLAVIIVAIAGLWKTFEKAGQPGWAAIVPIYNVYVMLEIAGRPAWWLILAFVPFANLILLVVPIDIAKRFGKGVGFGLGLLFLGFIFYPLLGFGDAQYRGRAA